MIKLYVGNLPYSYNSNTLKSLFESFGPVISSTIIQDRVSGRSKGFGFVELEDAQAQQAIAELNQKEIEGRKIVVNEAKPKEDKPRRDFNRSGSYNRY